MTDKFLTYLSHERNRSEQTVRRYGISLRDFEAYYMSVDAELDWASVDADIIRRWMESLMDSGIAASTIGTHLSALRSFYRFAMARDLVQHNPTQGLTAPKKRKPLPQFVKEEEMDRLLDEESWEESLRDVRARTIIIVLYEAGLRRGELTALNDDDVDFATRQLKVTGKRNKQRLVPFGDEVASALQEYISLRDDKLPRTSTALFVDTHGRRMTGSQVYKVVKENLSRVTTLKKRSPHVLRHSYATALLNHEAGLESVKQLLGHESLTSTQIYTHTTFEQLRRIYKEAHPRGQNLIV